MRRTRHHSKPRFRALCHLSAIGAMAVIAFNFVGLSYADDGANSATSYADVVAAINKTMRAYHYDPAELDTPKYRRIEAALAALAETASSDEALISEFREIWKEGPFSHVTLGVAQQSADDVADYLATRRIGGGGAQLTWRGDIAVLTVNTMMGLDTLEEIDAAYAEIVQREALGLVIDLRENGGGAFAVRPVSYTHLTLPTICFKCSSRGWAGG